MATRIGKDIRIRYSRDRGGEIILSQRIYGIRIGGADLLLTPITNSLAHRIVDGLPVDRQRLQPRNTIACIPNDNNAQGFSELKSVIPYLPGSPEHRQHLREIASFSNAGYEVKSIVYFSEST